MSPEQVRGLRLTPASDLFSLAVLIAQLALGRHPLYAVASDFDTLLAIRDCNYDLPATTPLLALCRAMLVPDLADRPTLADFRAGLAALA